MKKRMLLFVLMIVLLTSSIGFAGNDYDIPLEKRESLLSQRILEDGTIEVFTDINGQQYRKIFKIDEIVGEERDKKAGIQEFTMISSEEAKQYGKGLIIEDIPKDRDTEMKFQQYLELTKSGSSILPSSIDYSYSPYLPIAGDQGINNSCVAWASGYYVRTYQQAKDLGWDIKNGYGRDRTDRILSPSFIYNQIYIGDDEGAYFIDAYELLRTQGVSTWEKFPNIWGDYTTQPDEETILSAYPHRIQEHVSFNPQNYSIEESLDKIKEYLNRGELPLVGMFTGYNWHYPYYFDGNQFIIEDDYLGQEGGHLIVAVGYDDDIVTPDGVGALKIINSWGEHWGEEGYAYVTYEAFAKHSYHLAFIVDLPNDEIPEEEIIEFDRDKSIVVETKYNQPIDKVWTVKFNKDIKYDDYLKKQVFVVDKNSYAQKIDIMPGDDLSTIKISPLEEFHPGETYTIVLKDVQDSSGKELGQHTIMDFVIQ